MFIVYSKPNCSYCEQAKSLLKQKGVTYEERIVDVGQEKIEGKTYVTVQELKQVIPNAQSVPQIMLDDKLIGGFSDLKKMIGA